MMDTYLVPFGPTFTDDNGARYSVALTVSDCDDDSCDRCYQPLTVAIEPLGEPSPFPNPVLQLDISEGWGQLDALLAALGRARAHRPTV